MKLFVLMFIINQEICMLDKVVKLVRTFKSLIIYFVFYDTYYLGIQYCSVTTLTYDPTLGRLYESSLNRITSYIMILL